jgi:hypothetical protein
MSAIIDIWHSIASVFASSDYITLAIILVVTVGAGLITDSLAAIITATFIALVAFAVAVLTRAAIVESGKTDLSVLMQTDWHNFMGWQVQMLLAYAIIFAVLIASVSTIRKLVSR